MRTKFLIKMKQFLGKTSVLRVIWQTDKQFLLSSSGIGRKSASLPLGKLQYSKKMWEICFFIAGFFAMVLTSYQPTFFPVKPGSLKVLNCFSTMPYSFLEIKLGAQWAWSQIWFFFFSSLGRRKLCCQMAIFLFLFCDDFDLLIR